MPAPSLEETKHDDTSDASYTILVDVAKDQGDESKAVSPADDSSDSFEKQYELLLSRQGCVI